MKFIVCVGVILVGFIVLFVGHIPSQEPSPQVHTMTTTSVNVWFNETGLPTGTSWTVSATGIDPYNEPVTQSKSLSSASIEFASTFAYDSVVQFTISQTAHYGQVYKPSPSSGSITLSSLSNYGNVVHTSFAAVPGNLFTINILGGLPGEFYGLDWTGYITNNASFYQGIKTAATSISFNLANGTYYFQINGSVTAGVGYEPSVARGYITLSGNNYTLNERMNLYIVGQVYAVSFKETGLSAGHPWTLTVNNATFNETYTSVQQYISVNLTGGDTYNITANATGYVYLGASSFTFNTYAQQVTVPFQNPGGSTSQSLASLVGYIGLTVTTFFAIVLSIIGIVTMIFIARKSDDAMFPIVALAVMGWAGRAFGVVQTGYAVIITILCVAAYFISTELNKGGEVPI